MAQVEQGVLRQIWFAPVADPEDKTSFLIRDDAYSRSGAVFGRSVRLGDPISLGPNSTWVQTTWQGGEGQDTWQDAEMVDEATADMTTKLGKIRMWSGWKEAHSNTNRQVGSFLLDTAGADYTDTQPLLIAEAYDWMDLPSPTSQFRLYRYTGGSLTTVHTFSNAIQAICNVEQEEGSGAKKKILVGTSNGKIWVYNSVTNVFADDPEWTMELGHVGRNAMVPFNGAVYIGSKYRLSRRTFEPLDEEEETGGVTFKKVRDHNWLDKVENLVVWNNRIWFTGRTYGNTTYLFVSDGTTTNQVFKVNGSFLCTQLVVHFGSLYLVGVRAAGAGSFRSIGEVWRYNGSSLSKIWGEDPEDGSTENLPVWSGCSFGSYLVWGRSSAPSVDRPACLMYYDVELDAVHQGPTFASLEHPSSNGLQIFGVSEWSDTLACTVVDNTDYGSVEYPAVTVFLQRYPKKVAHDLTLTGFGGASIASGATGTISHMVRSSVYDGELPGQEKSWLSIGVRCKVPQYTQIVVKAIFDESGTEQTVGTISYDSGATGFRQVTLPLTVSGTYQSSITVQYVLYLQNTNPTSGPYNGPEVDSVVVDFMPVPDGRMQWRLRAIAEDEQVLLDGTANPLDTRDEIVSAIEDFYTSSLPLLYWDVSADGVPVGDGKEVKVTDFLEQSYRVNSEETTVVAELSVGLVEFASG